MRFSLIDHSWYLLERLLTLTCMGVIFFALLLAGCSLAPIYHRPTTPVATQWPVQSTSREESFFSISVMSWQDLFTDLKLRQVVQRALDNNRDMRIAVLNIQKAQAQYHIKRSELMPQIGVSGVAVAQSKPTSVSSTGIGGVVRSYSIDVGISAYELDLFGRIGSLKEEARQAYLSTTWARRATQISLISEVAGSYISLAADQDLQLLAHETLRSRQHEYDLQQKLTSVGKTSELSLHQAESGLENARYQTLLADKQVLADRNALELLMGAPLPTKLLPSSNALTFMISDYPISAGLPSALLQQRPDIVAAEHSLLGANADIGAARAAFFPSISLTTSTGRASNELGELFDTGRRSWNFSPQINLPIFSGGRLLAQLEVSKIKRDIVVAEYEKSIQSAFREVADSLAERSVVDEQTKAQRRNVDAAQASYDFVKVQNVNGLISYLEVLDAQRTLYAAQQSLIQSQLSQQNNKVTLYKSLGGGWDPAIP